MHAEIGSGVDVSRKVIDENRVGGVNVKSLEEGMKDARVRFDQPHFTGEQDSLKPTQEFESP